MPDKPLAQPHIHVTDGVPQVVVISPTDVTLFALMSIELMQSHPETAKAFCERLSGKSMPQAFLDEMLESAKRFVGTLALLREQAESASAEAEAATIPKDKLN
jgi:hypothetical protein